MTPLPAPLRWLHSLEWRRGFFDWARSDGVTWVYIFKVLIAAFLTLWLAMRLELPQPRTAMITVFIVMQPQSGQVFAKSFYRFLGTLAGSAVMVLLIALFAQNTELFLGALAIWVGICTAGATRNRNFRAYGFVLAGYTAAMVGLPALAHPDGAFMAAVWRVLEISLGILCSTLVSAAILPQTSSAAMRNALYQRFGVFALFVTDGLRGRSQREGFEASNVRFIAEAVGLEGLRSLTVFEDPHMRRRNGRLSRLNSEFMSITTRFNALHQLLERLRTDAADHVVAAIKPGLHDLAFLECRPEAAHLGGQAVLVGGELRDQACRIRAGEGAAGETVEHFGEVVQARLDRRDDMIGRVRAQPFEQLVQGIEAPYYNNPDPSFGHDYSDRTYTGWSPRLALFWNVTPNLGLFANWSKMPWRAPWRLRATVKPSRSNGCAPSVCVMRSSLARAV